MKCKERCHTSPRVDTPEIEPYAIESGKEISERADNPRKQLQVFARNKNNKTLSIAEGFQGLTDGNGLTNGKSAQFPQNVPNGGGQRGRDVGNGDLRKRNVDNGSQGRRNKDNGDLGKGNVDNGNQGRRNVDNGSQGRRDVNNRDPGGRNEGNGDLGKRNVDNGNQGKRNGGGAMKSNDEQCHLQDGNGLINGNGFPGLDLDKEEDLIDSISVSAPMFTHIIHPRAFPGLWYSKRTHTKVISSALVLMILFSTIIILTNDRSSSGIVIDGSFDDWASRTKVSDPIDDGYPDIVGSAIHVDRIFLSCYLEMATPLFQGYGTKGEIIRVFIDIDADAATGYPIQTLGSEFLVEIHGFGNHIRSAWYYSFNPYHRSDITRRNIDWNGWEQMFNVDTDFYGTELEFQLWADELSIPSGSCPRILFHSQASERSEDYSSVISEQGSIEVSTRSLLTSECIQAGVETPVLELSIRSNSALGVSINSISFMLYSTLHYHEIASSFIHSDASAADIKARIEGGRLFFTTEEDLTDSVVSEWSYTLRITLTRTVISGHAFVLGLKSIATAAGITTLSMETARGYAIAPPEEPVVDGLLSEYKIPKGDMDSKGQIISSIDSRVSNSIGIPFYGTTHLQFDLFDDPLQGSIIPAPHVQSNYPNNQKASHSPTYPSQQPPPPLPESSGENRILIFLETGSLSNQYNTSIDSNNHPNTSFGSIDTIVEILGIEGKITSIQWYKYGIERGNWTWARNTDSILNAILIDDSMELSIPIDDLIRGIVLVESWEEKSPSIDLSVQRLHQISKDNISELIDSPNDSGVRSDETYVCINEIFPNPESETDEWVELYNPTDSAISLDQWQLVDESSTIWTGAGTDSVPSGGVFSISLSNKLRNSGEKLEIFNSESSNIDNITYPSFSSYEGLSFSRIHDSSEYFERDPTPTGGMVNSIGGDIKINEILYDVAGTEPEGEFIELYHNGSSQKVMDNWTLRNDYRTPFNFDSTMDPDDFFIVDYQDTDLDSESYTECFGQYGLGGSQDFMVLENDLGQVVDRITYASEGTSDYFNESGIIVGYDLSARDVEEGNSLGRYPDGSDSNDDAQDFLECTITMEKDNVPILEMVSILLSLGLIFLIDVFIRRCRKLTRKVTLKAFDPNNTTTSIYTCSSSIEIG